MNQTTQPDQNNLYTFQMPLEFQAGDKADNGFPKYTGTIANTNLTSYYNHLSPSTLRSFAKNAREGVNVLANHNRGQVVGRSTSGTFTKDGEVRSDFYIQPGLNFANSPLFGSSGYASTDDFLKAIDAGTYRDVSVGFNQYKEFCDYCGEQVKYGFFYAGDKNGHSPGMTIYVDKYGEEYDEPGKGRTEVLITSEITEGNLYEYSLVDMGALPGAEILKQAELAKIGDREKSYLFNRYGVNFSEPDQMKEKTFRFVEPIQLLPENKSYSFPKGDFNMDPITQAGQETLEALQAENVRLANENREFQAQSDTYQQGQIELTKKSEELKAASEKIAELEEKDRINEAKLAEYNMEKDRLIEYTFSEYTRAKGGTPDREGFNTIVVGLESIQAIKKLANDYKIQGDLRLNRMAAGHYINNVHVPAINSSDFDIEDYI